MKNTIKMSLVAALAVSALSSTASAGSLEEAIKGVTISGKMEVEYDYTKTERTGGTETTSDVWDLDWDITAKIPVNDYITAIVGAEGDNNVATGSADQGTLATNGETQILDSNVNVTKTYFQYANGPVTAMVGKQGMAGAPWFDDERGNGLVGLYNAGFATFAAAYFTDVNAGPAIANGTVNTSTSLASTFGKTAISAAAAIFSAGPVNAQLWYAQLSGIDSTNGGTAAQNQVDADSFAILLDATFDIVNVGLKYAEADYDQDNAGTTYNALDDDAEMLQLSVSADFGVAIPYIAYGATDSKQGGAGLDLTSDTDSTLDFGSETLSIDDLDNADAIMVGVTVPFGDWKFDVSYVDGEYDDYLTAGKTQAYGADFDELFIQADYKMSKNFTIGAHYTTAEIEDQISATVKQEVEIDAASISLEYKF